MLDLRTENRVHDLQHQLQVDRRFEGGHGRRHRCRQAFHSAGRQQEPTGQSPPTSNERFVLPERSPGILPEPIPSPAVVTAQKPKLELPPPSPAVEPKKNQETVVIPPIGSQAAPRRSFADITAKPQFGHAADYTWLTGEIWYVPQKDQWRLRFASIDEEDRYGGAVTLDARSELQGYKSGQLVRVDGSMVDPESRGIAPKYRIKEIRLLAK